MAVNFRLGGDLPGVEEMRLFVRLESSMSDSATMHPLISLRAFHLGSPPLKCFRVGFPVFMLYCFAEP